MLINTLYPTYITTYGVGYACQSLLDGMRGEGVDVRFHCISADNSVKRPFHRFSIPLWAKPIGYRLMQHGSWAKYTEWRYRNSLKGGDIAYIWPGTSIDTFRMAKSAGHIVLTENINTHQATSKKILDDEYRRLGLVPDHGIDDSAVEEESAKLEYVDHVFSPSREVSKSLLDADVPNSKIIDTSYGLDRTDILATRNRAIRKDELTALFVGRIGIRKGALLLLDYWVKAGVKGKLKLVGNVERNVQHLIEPYLKRSDIEHVPFTKDLRALYSDADVFVFPSLEEGSPLVTYLALGAGLPSIVSAMGSGGIVDDGREGLVVDPHDADGWIDSMRRLFSDTEYRLYISGNAFDKSEAYLWANVGRLRRERLLASLGAVQA